MKTKYCNFSSYNYYIISIFAWPQFISFG